MMRRDAAVFLLLLSTGVPAVAAAQSSQFGVRGLGLLGRPGSAHSTALGGSLTMFDGESGQNPASLSTLTTMTSLFSSVETWRNSKNPDGGLATRDTRFPHLLIGGPLNGVRVALAVSFSTYADRDFTIATRGTASPRGEPIGVTDTLASRGGINDLQLGGAWGPARNFSVGVGIHFLTGANRLATRRVWDDTTYLAPRESAELSYRGVGLSAGFLWRVVPGLDVAGMVRRDGSLDVQRDTSSSGKIQMPITLSGGVRFAPSGRMALSAQLSSSSWSRADPGLRAQGGIGAKNTIDYSAGLEYFRNPKRPVNLPLRIGVFHSTLPFLLVDAPQPKATGFSFGSGVRFAGDRGGIDFALERITRSQGSSYKESAWQLTFGVSVRAGGFTP